MLRDLISLKNCRVAASDGPVGRITDFYLDDEAWVVCWVVVDCGKGLAHRKVLIAPHLLRIPMDEGRVVRTELSRREVGESPSVDAHLPVSQQYRTSQGEYAVSLTNGVDSRGRCVFGPAQLPRDTGLSNLDYARSVILGAASNGELDAVEHGQNDPHLRSAARIASYALHVGDAKVGQVSGLLMEDQTWAIRYIVVRTGPASMRHDVLIAPEWIEDINWLDATISVDLKRESIDTAPWYDRDHLPNREFEHETHRHFGREGYWSSDGGPASIVR